ncbi:hypothetical protein [Microbacterium sp.]|uniref:hypothetical protein n=1 Tax=Microbacterium sp. TaxID=51671 RepID=UPI0039E6DBDD
MAYPNGLVPLHLLVHLGGNHYLPPGTAARWLWAVAEGKRRFGVTFRITPDRDGLGGWNAYRPMSAQILYKKKLGNLAAAPGYSTHGGFVGGREVFAVDVDNWQAVPWADFARLMNNAGFAVDYVTPRELWHVVDLNNPWVAPTLTGATTTNTNPPVSEEDDMPLMVKANGNIYTLSPQQIKHEIDTAVVQRAIAAGHKQVDLTGTNAEQVAALAGWLDHFGIPQGIDGVAMIDAAGRVLNPETGKHEAGGMWNWDRANRALLKQLLARK